MSATLCCAEAWALAMAVFALVTIAGTRALAPPESTPAPVRTNRRVYPVTSQGSRR